MLDVAVATVADEMKSVLTTSVAAAVAVSAVMDEVGERATGMDMALVAVATSTDDTSALNP